MTSWFYRDIVEDGGNHVYVVGFYDPAGKWVPETDWNTADEAAMRVHWLNGGRIEPTGAQLGITQEDDDDNPER